MKIEFTLDEENGIEIYNLLGDIILSKDNFVIKEKDVYLDSWFVALIDGITELKEKDEVSIDLVEEP